MNKEKTVVQEHKLGSTFDRLLFLAKKMGFE